MCSILHCVSITRWAFLQVRPEVHYIEVPALWWVTSKNSVFLSDSYTFWSNSQESPTCYGDAAQNGKHWRHLFSNLFLDNSWRNSLRLINGRSLPRVYLEGVRPWLICCVLLWTEFPSSSLVALWNSSTEITVEGWDHEGNTNRIVTMVTTLSETLNSRLVTVCHTKSRNVSGCWLNSMATASIEEWFKEI